MTDSVAPLLGELAPVDPRTIWPREDSHFTPWLLEHAEGLGRALGIELELTTAEHPIGSYSLDLIGEDKSHGVVLIVENQLEQSDHDHLGKLLTYAAGTEASTVVWITTQFRAEHQLTLAWLNEHTDEATHFFGVELQVVRIGDSLPAPLFNVVAKPNDWGKAVKASTASTAGARSQLYLSFWTKFLDAVRDRHRDWTRATPTTWNSCWMSAKARGVGYNCVFAANSIIRHEVYIDRPSISESHAVFEHLLARREAIEARYGKPLEWDAVDGRKVCRISDATEGDITREDEYDSYVEWFITTSEALRLAVAPELPRAATAGDLAIERSGTAP